MPDIWELANGLDSNSNDAAADPDHDALQSFIPNDIQNGAIVKIVALPTSVEFVWQDGKVVDDKGNVIMDCMPKKQTKK